MATQGTPIVPFGEGDRPADAAVQRPWRMRAPMSRMATAAEAFLDRSSFDRGPWLTVFLATGIGLWFVLHEPWQWIMVAAICVSFFVSAGLWKGTGDCPNLRLAVAAIGLAIALGLAVISARSALIGAEPIDYPRMMTLDARILERQLQPAEGRARLVVATRDGESGEAFKVRVNVPSERYSPAYGPGARVHFKARLMPPAPPLLPGAYDFARRAWFDGYAATGSLSGTIKLIEPAPQSSGTIARVQEGLSHHVRERLEGSAGTIAAAFASGDRGAIAKADEAAMRDAGLTHLLSISGLHVSAVIAAAYFLVMKSLGLCPWLALRIRLPLLAAAIAAGAGIAYTLLTGAEVPTVRSCVGALLVLIALALGREPLSMRMVAAAAAVVLFLWPESLVGPSFQMSFAAVIAIVALHNCSPVRDFLAPTEESWMRRTGKRVVMLFVTGLVIEIALTPIVLFHFHRAGLYGAFANVIAIPLVTFASMPLIAIALLLDLIGAGAPFWWLAGQSLDLMLWIAHVTAAQPGAVKLVPHIGLSTVLFFVAGGLWLALWRGSARLAGFGPVAIGAFMLATAAAPDILVARDGRDVGLVGDDGRLFVLRDKPGSYAQANLVELGGTEVAPWALDRWPGARCSPDFCSLPISRNGDTWFVLVSRSREMIDERALAAACERTDIVISDRWLPQSCRPKWLKSDRRFLKQNGGLAIYLDDHVIETVAEHQGSHGWWKGATGD